MAKFFISKLITTAFIGILLSSCNSKKDNFEIDLSDFKIPNKKEVAVSTFDFSDTSKTTNKIIKNNLISYQTNAEVFSSIKLGKIDPFSEEGKKDKVNNLNTNFKLTGFLNTKDNKYVFVSYLGQIGSITEESVGGENTNLLPNGAKVKNIDPKELKLIINFEDKDYILEL